MQVLPVLRRIARATDVVMVNWGLHYSKGYGEQLHSLLRQACSLLLQHQAT